MAGRPVEHWSDQRWPYPWPPVVADDVRLNDDARTMWGALAVTADARGRVHVARDELARRCGWTTRCTDPECTTCPADGSEPLGHDTDRVLRAIDRLYDTGHVIPRPGGRYELPWVGLHADDLAAAGLLPRRIGPRQGGTWFDIGAALADADDSGLRNEAQHWAAIASARHTPTPDPDAPHHSDRDDRRPST